MNPTYKTLILQIIHIIDWVLSPVTALASMWLKLIRKAGIHRMKASKIIFNKVGIYPIRDHYYEPMFNTSRLKKPLSMDRDLPGIDFNINEQLTILKSFSFTDELLEIPIEKTSKLEFYYNNGPFSSGDAEYLYNIIRLYKPKKIIEVGSGNSTLMARNAINRNKSENQNYLCEHICIEPYQHPWLEKLDIEIVRNLVEDTERSLFLSLGENDILFIDSSHIIRPQGDVLVEYLEVMPLLRSGVLVHIHDIFTPKDYLDDWVKHRVRLWNEQYLLEAFLTLNNEFRIIGSLNYLKHHYPLELSSKCPILAQQFNFREPGSFWLRRN